MPVPALIASLDLEFVKYKLLPSVKSLVVALLVIRPAAEDLSTPVDKLLTYKPLPADIKHVLSPLPVTPAGEPPITIS